jgi:hypothetical protein
MSKIKEAKRSMLRMMPAEGWIAVCTDDDGLPPETTHVPLHDRPGATESDIKMTPTQMTGSLMNDGGQGQGGEACRV